jgi:hypothetical protein
MNLIVELSTPRGTVFIGETSSVELKTGDGSVLMLPPGNTVISMTGSSTIVLRCGSNLKRFLLENATLGLRGGRLTILAEVIQPVKRVSRRKA